MIRFYYISQEFLIMLKNVHLNNLALIKEADIDFGRGLNILTGETGAGKSIIIGSINIALGDKASKSFIRTGADHGLVELVFTDPDDRVKELLASMEIPSEDDTVIISRRITADSSSCRINGVTVTLNKLRSVTALLVDIHGQHDHQSLLQSTKHLDIVDEYGKEEIGPLKTAFRENYDHFRALRSSLRQFPSDPQQLKRDIDLAQFECREIEAAQLKPGEDTRLEEEFHRLGHAREINEGLEKIRANLFGDSGSALSAIQDALKNLGHLQTLDPSLESFAGTLMDLDALAEDLDRDLTHYISSHDFNAQRYDELRTRLEEIGRLKDKYGATIDAVLAYKESARKRLDQLNLYISGKDRLQKEMDAAKLRLRACADALSAARIKCAHELEQKILDNLKDLNFQEIDFRIDVSKADKIYETGYDKVEFLISTNVGEPVKPLVKVASGGELSRVMLAIKASVADADHISTLIFDEIDTGISGRTAQKVAEKLAVLSKNHQLICITHLPQIAAMADTHFAIEKSRQDGTSISGIRRLSRPDSILELARLISGSEITESTLKSAEEMKKSAATLKGSADD